MSKIYDHLVIGAGIAGLVYSIKAAQKGDSVCILVKGSLICSNTYYAQGGIAAVTENYDSQESHLEDTIKAGGGLCNKEIAQKIIESGKKAILELIDLGVNFSQKGEKFSLHKEGGHSFHRIFHHKDITGKEIVRALLEKAQSLPNIIFKTNMVSIDLLTEHQKDVIISNNDSSKLTCYGVYALDSKKQLVDKILAKTTILATGGSGQVYQHTSNPEVATGDGLAMAYRAKASIVNLEFFQFHPTTLYTTKSQGCSFLITEAMRGFGADLKDINGKSFMDNYHTLKSLAPRDIVARAIDTEMKKSGSAHVYLDVTNYPAKDIIKAFPNIYKKCLEDESLDITKNFIPVVPAAHYQCGGVAVDFNGVTDLNGLYAVGEVAHTGLHGANRLASNSLLEATILALNACSHSRSYIKKATLNFENIADWHDNNTKPVDELIISSYLKGQIKSIMSSFVGIVRSDERLRIAGKWIDLLLFQIREYYKNTQVSRATIELRNLADVASLIIRSAYSRKESRGLHHNINYPNSLKDSYDTIIKANKK